MAKKKKKTSKAKGFRRCPDCKVKGVCKTCGGHGKVRITQGRSKGNRFENDVAKQISEWVGVSFKRTPMSGGWAKTGDITPKNPKEMVSFPFAIECKNQENFNMAFVLEGAKKGELPKNTVAKWWKQCTEDAEKSKKFPLLVMTKAREPVYVMMESWLFRELDLMKKASFIIRFKGLRVMLWDEFLLQEYEECLIKLSVGV